MDSSNYSHITVGVIVGQSKLFNLVMIIRCRRSKIVKSKLLNSAKKLTLCRILLVGDGLSKYNPSYNFSKLWLKRVCSWLRICVCMCVCVCFQWFYISQLICTFLKRSESNGVPKYLTCPLPTPFTRDYLLIRSNQRTGTLFSPRVEATCKDSPKLLIAFRCNFPRDF